jgi:hypothetical protein
MSTTDYGLAEGLADALPEADAPAEPDTDASADALADADAAALPEALGSTEMLGAGVGLAGGKSAVGTFRNARTKMRMKITSTTSTHGRAIESYRGGRAPR